MLFRLRFFAFPVLVGLLALWQQIQAQVEKLSPVDEASRDPSFFLFRARLFAAIRQRDAAFILSIVSPEIRNSFGGIDGVAEFKEFWKPEQPNTELWKTLTDVLSLGGSFRDSNTFVAPYTFSEFPNQFDFFEYGVIVEEHVKVRQRASLDSPVIATLAFDIVSVSDWSAKNSAGSKQAWIPVKLANGSRGHVAAEYVRSPLDYRAFFERKDGNWFLWALVAAD